MKTQWAILILAITLTFSSSVEARNSKAASCKADVAELSISKRTKPKNVEELTAEWADALAKYVTRYYEVPTRKPLAEYLEVKVNVVTQFFKHPNTPDTIAELLDFARKKQTESLDKFRVKVARVVGNLFKETYAVPHVSDIAEALEMQKHDLQGILGSELDDIVAFTMSYYENAINSVRNAILNNYATLCKFKRRDATLEELAERLEISVDLLHTLVSEKPGQDALFFDGRWALYEQAKKERPASFRKVIDRSQFGRQNANNLLELAKSSKHILVTGAVAGARVVDGFIDAAETWSKAHNDAPVFVFPINGETEDLSPEILENPRFYVISHDVELTPWLRLWTIPVIAKQKNALEGLQELLPRRMSFVIGAPKIEARTVPTIDNDYHPRLERTSGAMTVPAYWGEKFISHRTDDIASLGHFIGGIVLEASPGNKNLLDMNQAGTYQSRVIEWIPEDRGFMDLNKFYSAEGEVSVVRHEAIVLGDFHTGATDQELISDLHRMVKKFRPKRIVLHDVFDGKSISHHDDKAVVTLAEKAKSGVLDLEYEASNVVNAVNAMLSWDPSLEIVIIKSNHDEWIDRYINDQRNARDKASSNAAIAAELYDVMINSRGTTDPIEYLLLHGGNEYVNRDPSSRIPNRNRLLRGGGIEDPSRVSFVKRSESLKLGKEGIETPEEIRQEQPNIEPHYSRLVELAEHGDRGANGGRGSLRTFARATDRILYGDSHQYARKNSIVNVGTATKLRMGYNRDASSWVQGLVILGPNGEQQELLATDGRWYVPEDTEFSMEGFHPAGYPRVVPRNEPPDSTGQVDQWSHYHPGDDTSNLGKSARD